MVFIIILSVLFFIAFIYFVKSGSGILKEDDRLQDESIDQINDDAK